MKRFVNAHGISANLELRDRSYGQEILIHIQYTGKIFESEEAAYEAMVKAGILLKSRADTVESRQAGVRLPNT